MPVTHVTDDNGCTMTVLDMDGYLLPNFPIPNVEENIRSIENWKSRDDDIMLCAYPKSGTHWIWEIIRMILNNKAERIMEDKGSLMVEAMNESMYNDKTSPRVLNSHLYPQRLPKDFFAKKCRIVLIHRNPKDVAVSYFNHHKNLIFYEYEGTWDGYLKLFTDGKVDYGSWFAYTLHMEKFIAENPDYPIHVVHYEDMTENGTSEIKRLAKFLGVDLTDDTIKDIEKLCQFDSMKKDKEELLRQQNPEMLERICRDKKIMIYRKGTVSDWKNWFTEAQNEAFDNVYAEKMKNATTELRFSIDN